MSILVDIQKALESNEDDLAFDLIRKAQFENELVKDLSLYKAIFFIKLKRIDYAKYWLNRELLLNPDNQNALMLKTFIQTI